MPIVISVSFRAALLQIFVTVWGISRIYPLDVTWWVSYGFYYAYNALWNLQFLIYFLTERPISKTLSNYLGAYEECSRSSTVNYYWYRKTLNITTTINENGDLQWWMVISLAVAWGAVYLCTIRGIQSTGKVILNKFMFCSVLMLALFHI